MSSFRDDLLRGDAIPARMLARFLRQFRLPSKARAISEGLVIASLFMACGWMTSVAPLAQLLWPMLVVTLVMLGGMVASGVYRVEIWPSVAKICLHSTYGLVIGGTGALLTLEFIAQDLLVANFVFLFLFLTYFALNTLRPLCSINEPNAGTGRRVR